jgi:hypothetical protein
LASLADTRVAWRAYPQHREAGRVRYAVAVLAPSWNSCTG